MTDKSKQTSIDDTTRAQGNIFNVSKLLTINAIIS